VNIKPQSSGGTLDTGYLMLDAGYWAVRPGLPQPDTRRTLAGP